MPLLSAQEILQMEDDEVIIYYANKAPIRAKRMDIRRFPKLEARLSEAVPEIPKLPPFEDGVLTPIMLHTRDRQEGRGEPEHEFVNPEQYVQ